MTLPSPESLHTLVARVFSIEDVTAGDHTDSFIIRYRGQLTVDSVQACEQLTSQLENYQLTPLFRKEQENQHVIYLVRTRQPVNLKDNLFTVIGLFILTVLAVMLTAVEIPKDLAPTTLTEYILLSFRYILTGFPFALSLLSILLAH